MTDDRTWQMSQDMDATYTEISLEHSQQQFDTCGMLDCAATFPAEAVNQIAKFCTWPW